MNQNLDKASGAFIYTLLTSDFPRYDDLLIRIRQNGYPGRRPLWVIKPPGHSPHLNGSLIFSLPLGVPQGNLDLKHFTPGVYWVKFQFPHSTQSTQRTRIVIQD